MFSTFKYFQQNNLVVLLATLLSFLPILLVSLYISQHTDFLAMKSSLFRCDAMYSPALTFPLPALGLFVISFPSVPTPQSQKKALQSSVFSFCDFLNLSLGPQLDWESLSVSSECNLSSTCKRLSCDQFKNSN